MAQKRKIPGWAVGLVVALLALFGLSKIGGEPSSIRALGFEVFGTGGGGGGNGGTGPTPGPTSPDGGFFGGIGAGLQELGKGIAYTGTAGLGVYGAYKAVKAAKGVVPQKLGGGRYVTSATGVFLTTGVPFIGVGPESLRQLYQAGGGRITKERGIETINIGRPGQKTLKVQSAIQRYISPYAPGLSPFIPQNGGVE